VRAFALAPGVVRTRLFVNAGGGEHINTDTAALPAATALYLTSGRADWLSGRSVGPHVLYYIHTHAYAHTHRNPARYYSANWDVAEVERDWKDAILEQKALVNKLSVPKI
jgi:hypothetical protein